MKEDIQPREEQSFMQYALDHTKLNHQIGGEDCLKITINYNGLVGSRVITSSEVRALEVSENDTKKTLELLKKYWADSPKSTLDP